MKRNPNALCGNCPYFNPSPDGSASGQCQRRAPELTTGLIAMFPVVPMIMPGCGEHPDLILPEPQFNQPDPDLDNRTMGSHNHA